ncbi:2-oxoglutarate ferredoxin oxidoreductase subunit alpha, partial [Streptomyces sp. NPDC005548]
MSTQTYDPAPHPVSADVPAPAGPAPTGADTRMSVHTTAPATTGVYDKEVRRLDRVVIRFAGDSGDGMQLTGDRFTAETASFGNDLSTLP